MIFSFYIFLFSVALILIFLGYYSKTDILKIVSYGLIFMLGFMLISQTPFGAVQDCEHLQTSADQNTTNPNDALWHYNYTYTCQDIENRTFGFWIAVLGVLGFASVYFQRKGGSIDNEESF